ncbi:hypothetical protein V8C34DRAFT_317599 [Trichoderma compactum]
MSSAALNGGKRHVHVLARGWSTSNNHPRTADAAHRRRFGCPWLGPVKIGGWCGVLNGISMGHFIPSTHIPTAWFTTSMATLLDPIDE